MKKDKNARCGILTVSVSGSRLRRLARWWTRASDGGNCSGNGYIRSHPPPFPSAGLRFDRRWSSRYRRVRRRLDIDPSIGLVPFLADARRRPSHPADDGSRQSRFRSIDSPGRLYDHAGRLVVAGTAPTDPCNLATSTAIATERQRSILAKLIAAIIPVRSKYLTDTPPAEFYGPEQVSSQPQESMARADEKYGLLPPTHSRPTSRRWHTLFSIGHIPEIMKVKIHRICCRKAYRNGLVPS
mgnify:CR=1 FL=1